jgi:hypothetical protein
MRGAARSTFVNRQQIEEAVEFLDSQISRENARVKLHQYGGGPDEGQIIANEAGYLRLGIEFLKAAFAAPRANQEFNAVDVDIDYLITNDSTINFDWFERRELPSVEPTATGARIVPVLIGCSFLAVLLFAFVGIMTTISWLVQL